MEAGSWKGTPGMRDYTKIQCGIQRETFTGYGIWLLLTQIWAPVGIGNENDIQDSAMKEVRDAGFSWKRSGNAGRGTPFPDPVEDDLDHYAFLGNCPPTPPLGQR